MLHIILGILKLIGIVLAVLLLLILGILLAVLLVPVRYQGTAEKTKDTTKAAIRVTWLLHLISVSVSLDLLQRRREFTIKLFGLSLQTILAGIRRIASWVTASVRALKRIRAGRGGKDAEEMEEDSEFAEEDGEESSEFAGEDEREDSESAEADGNEGFEFEKADRDESSKFAEEDGEESSEFAGEDEREDSASAEADRNEGSEFEKTDRDESSKFAEEDGEESSEFAGEDEHEDSEFEKADRDESSKFAKADEKENSEPAKTDGDEIPAFDEADESEGSTFAKASGDEGVAFENEAAGGSKKPLAGRFSEKIKKIWYRIHAIYDKIKAIFSKIRELAQNAAEIPARIAAAGQKAAGFLDMLEEYEARAVLHSVMTELFRLLGHYRPRTISGYLYFGTGDPALTGQLVGLIYLLLPARAESFRVTPEFTKPAFETELVFRGHIRSVHVLGTAWRLFRNKKLRRLIGQIRRMRAGRA